MAEQFSKWDVQDYLKTPEDCLLYLQACFDEAGDDASFIAKALGDVARAHGMARLSRDTGISREGLHKALSADGNPALGTVLKVMRALGVRLQVAPG